MASERDAGPARAPHHERLVFRLALLGGLPAVVITLAL
jgi:hypothetical protein